MKLQIQGLSILMALLLTSMVAADEPPIIPKAADIIAADQAAVERLGPGKGALTLTSDIRAVKGLSAATSGVALNLNRGVVDLKAEVREHTYQFYYSFNNENWFEIPVTFESFKLSDEYVRANGFTGAFVGMHCHDTSGCNQHADFDYFSYKELK